MKLKNFLLLLIPNLLAAEYVEFDSLQNRNDAYYQINSQIPYTGDVIGYYSLDDSEYLESISQDLQLITNSLNNTKLINKTDYIDLIKSTDTAPLVKKQIVKLLKIKEISSMKNGLYDGPYEDFYENGQTWSKSQNIIEGKEDGLWENFDFDGQILQRIIFKNGKENGLVQRFYDNGQLKQNYESKEDIYHGIFQEYYENGQLKEDSIMKEGERKQVLTFYENGQWKEKASYPGTIERFHKNGQLQLKASTDDGGIFGFVEVRYEQGNIKERITLPTGEVELFHKNGAPLLKTGVKNGKFHGRFKEYLNYKYEGVYHLFQEGIYENGIFVEDEIKTKIWSFGGSIVYCRKTPTGESYGEKCSDENHNSVLIKKDKNAESSY